VSYAEFRLIAADKTVEGFNIGINAGGRATLPSPGGRTGGFRF